MDKQKILDYIFDVLKRTAKGELITSNEVYGNIVILQQGTTPPTDEGLREKIAELEQALKDDVSDLWTITNAIKKEIDSRDWILEGRGSYAWDDDKYREEAGYAFDAIRELIKNVQHPAQQRFHQVLSDLKPLLQQVIERDYVRLDKDQTPPIPNEWEHEDADYLSGYAEARQAMIKAGWRKIR